MKTKFQLHQSIKSIASKYDGFILDQFGVMHNGHNGLEGASECVKQLHDQGKKLVILSNTSSTSSAALQKLPKLGFDPSCFIGAVTSGEEASHYIKDNFKGEKGLWITWSKTHKPSPMTFLEQCGDIEIVDLENIAEAKFIVVQGSGVLRGRGNDDTAKELSLDGFFEEGNMNVVNQILDKCLEHKLTMVCANPDYFVVKPDNTRAWMPGHISDKYQKMGGVVHNFGKPHKPHFEACLEKLSLPRDKVVHVGDSIHHDIQGANSADIDSIFVVGGVHRETLGKKLGELPDDDTLQSFFDKEQQTPTHVVPLFRMM